jgi:H/ACA ribonucleoprotein complex subunit 4
MKIQELLEFGIININKPSGPTSFNISDFVRKKLKLRKTSHFGTLDPKVTGVLPIALNRACKLTGYFIGHDKEYIGIARFHENIDIKKVQKVIDEKFMGKILQTPPVKSRVKRQEREREIYSFELLEKEGKDILFRAEVQGGTYIRKLIDDLGKELGIGAHMLELRRTRAGIFEEDDKKFPAVNLYDFEKAVDEERLDEIIVPAGDAVKKIMPSVQFKKSEIKRLLTGKAVFVEDVLEAPELKKDDIFAGFSGENFIGIYKVTNEEKKFARSEFVMQPMGQ